MYHIHIQVESKGKNAELPVVKPEPSQLVIERGENQTTLNSVSTSSQVTNNEEASIELEEDAIENVEIIQIGDEHGSKRRKFNRIDDDVVKLALEEHPLGSAIQIYSCCKVTLDTICQSYLTTIVTTYCLKVYGL